MLTSAPFTTGAVLSICTAADANPVPIAVPVTDTLALPSGTERPTRNVQAQLVSEGAGQSAAWPPTEAEQLARVWFAEKVMVSVSPSLAGLGVTLPKVIVGAAVEGSRSTTLAGALVAGFPARSWPEAVKTAGPTGAADETVAPVHVKLAPGTVPEQAGVPLTKSAATMGAAPSGSLALTTKVMASPLGAGSGPAAAVIAGGTKSSVVLAVGGSKSVSFPAASLPTDAKGLLPLLHVRGHGDRALVREAGGRARHLGAAEGDFRVGPGRARGRRENFAGVERQGDYVVDLRVGRRADDVAERGRGGVAGAGLSWQREVTAAAGERAGDEQCGERGARGIPLGGVYRASRGEKVGVSEP